MVTDVGWQGFYVHVHQAAETMQDDWDDGDRHVPSPSTVSACRLQQWFKGQKIPRSNRIPVESIKKMESGTAIENFWRQVYSRAGFLVVSPPPPVVVGAMRSKGGDGILWVWTDGAASAVGLPKNTPLLLELKDLGAWSYMDFVTKGLKEGLPDYYDQVQSYLEGYGLEYCVFHAGMADASGTKFIWKRIRKLEPDCPPFWMEVVGRDPVVLTNTLKRAEEVDWAINNLADSIPLELRDFDAPKLSAEKKFPCAWCGWEDLCVGKQKVVSITDYQRGRNA